MLTSESSPQLSVEKLAERSHAVLIYGQPGSGTHEFADRLTRAWLCHKDGCDECNICRSLDSDRCVDLMTYRPYGAGNVIKVGAIKPADKKDDEHPSPNLVEFLRTPPMMARVKVARFEQVERTHTKAFNAMLKILEEPPNYAKFVLLTNEFSKIPPTIRSRCIPIGCASEKDTSLPEIFQIFGGTNGLNESIRQHEQTYSKLWSILEESKGAPKGAAIGLSERTRALAEEFSKVSNGGTRGGQLEILRCISCWLLAKSPEKPRLAHHSVDAHRLIAGNASSGPIFDLLWARILD